MNNSQYAFKNALLYTVLITIILLVPLYIYMVYMKTITQIQNELFLKKQHALIISAMEEYDEESKTYFEYPRFSRFESGLYDVNFQAIFTLIQNPLEHSSAGYHMDKHGYAYLIVPLPENRYFGADYLIMKNELNYTNVYQRVLSIALAITMLVFLLSIFFLKRFSLPYARVNKQLDDFIKDSMHEINTPLSIINVNIDLYNRKNSTNKYLQRIKAASKTLSNIYNDMDYLIKHKRLAYAYERINLSAYVQDRVLYFNEVAQMKEIVIISDINEHIYVNFNTSQLQRIIDNSISNAIKYSDESSTIEVTLSNENKICKLSFKDYGIGIKDTSKVFQRYHRENHEKGGFGIGLNIVKSIMDESGIELELISTLGIGSTFSYIFPSSLLLE
ncbi:HAMP domain-containing histidine kinase [Sulfurimonas sp. MAG313]|nr:HAMP domain-containing sensor histidine kinase [Sulfurimonas sp. MAG313]MDF1880545.1 HAMP domain-containing histidine kinase [Sulfurimonas sp. MAG313]